MSDVCGPFTLDQLDVFGSIDNLNISLDSEIWLSADTCVLQSSGAISGQGEVTAQAGVIRGGEAVITGSGALSADGFRQRLGEAVLTGSGSLTADALRVKLGEAEITGSLQLTALGGINAEAFAYIQAFGTISVSPGLIFSGAGAFSGVGTVTARGYIFGEEWSNVPEEVNTWTPVAPESNTWTPVQAGQNTWQ